MAGTIRCTKCNSAFDKNKGVCSKCGHYKGWVDIYWKGKHYAVRQGKDGKPFGYMQALDFLLDINRDMRDPEKSKSFNVLDYLAPNVKARKLENIIEKWIEQKKAEASQGELSPGTLKDYFGYVKNYFIPMLGALDIRDIRYEHLNDFRNRLPGSLKLKTRRNILNALHAAFIWLWKQGDIEKVPPFPAIEGFDATIREAHTAEEQEEGLKKIPEQHRDIIEFGFETGLRSGELCAIKICDIKAASRKIRVQRQVYNGVERETTKGKRKDEVILSDHSWEILIKNLRGRAFNDYLFINPETERRYTAKKLNWLWKTYSGFTTCFHEACRHSFCSQLGEAEENPMILQDLMRHSDIRTTKGYCHPRDEKIRDIVNRRGKVVLVSIKKIEKSE